MQHDYQTIAEAIQFLDRNFQRQPSLAEVAESAGLTEFHFQRMFRRRVGISPKRFLQFATARYIRERLAHDRPLIEAMLDAGVSGPGRLHDLTVNVYAVTPAELRQRGAGVEIRHGFADSPLGECHVAATARGLCALRFVDEDGRAPRIAELRHDWPSARLSRDDDHAARLAGRVFARGGRAARERPALDLVGTNFQLRVWEALLRIPSGMIVTYGDLAANLGLPAAARAVGTAVGRNPVSVLIPCHRVLRETGALGGYRWGLDRKRVLLAWEGARRAEAVNTAIA